MPEQEQINWPECPHGLTNLEDFFNMAKEAVTVEWQRTASGLLESKYQEWLAQIPDTEENQDIIRLLSNPLEMDKKLKVQQLGEIEGLKNVLPEAWRALVLASSERQLATLTVLRYWLKNNLSDADLSALGSSRPEMEILLDAGGVLGKYIDHAYVKQIELAQEPGGTSKTKSGLKTGAEYVYDIYKSPHNNDVEVKNFSQVFTGEWPKIAHSLQLLSRKVENFLQEGKLPPNYRGLPEFLENLVLLYQSQEISPAKLDEMWRDLNIKINELAKSGCPLMFIPGNCVGVTDDAGKIDIELRLGIRLEGLIALENSLEEFRQIAQKIMDKHLDKMAEPYTVPKMVLNIQPLAFGSSLQFFTAAETGGDRMVSHVNVNNEEAAVNHFPIIERLFSQQFIKLSRPDYFMSVNLDTSLHETGHNVMPTEDKAIRKRLGRSTEATVLEELKAESFSMVLLKENLKTKKDETENKAIAEKQFFTKLITILNYLTNKSSDKGTDGERYFYPGLAIFLKLLDKGILIEEEGTYRLTNAQAGIEVIADLGQEILDRFYLNEASTPQQVRKYISELRAKKDDVRIKAIKDKVKG